jgi:predicted ATPase
LVGGAIVSGEAGMGTTKLLRTFSRKICRKVHASRVQYVVCRERGEPFGPIRGLLRQRFDISNNLEPMAARLRLTNQVGKILGSDSAALVTETAHLLGLIAGIAFPQSPVLRFVETNPRALERKLEEALARFFAADLVEGPVVLFFDDLHKASPEAVRVLLGALERIENLPLAVIIGGRPEVNSITENPTVVRLRLEPLDEEVMRTLLLTFLPELEDPPSELVDALLGRSAGNPGSMHELCNLLLESGVIDTQVSPWTADLSKLASSNIPAGLLDALKARVDALDPRDRVVLQQAAIVGEVFWDEAVVALSRQHTKHKKPPDAGQIWADDSDALRISSCFERLGKRQFVVQLPDTDIRGCVKYAFARSGVRDQILSTLEPEMLTQGHYLVATWMSHAVTPIRSSLFEEEAVHWEKAGQRHRAAKAIFAAARFARSRYLNQKAIKLFRAGLEAADPMDKLTLVDAWHDLGSVHELVGESGEAEKCFNEMMRLAWMLMHRGKGGAALNRIGRIHRARGDGAAARAYLNRAMTLFKSARDERGVAASLADLGELARREGSYERAHKLLSEALTLQRKLENKPSLAVCLHTLGHIETARGSYDQAQRYLEEALTIRRDSGDKGGMGHTLSALAILLIWRGDIDAAIARWESALSLSEEVGDRRMQAIVLNNLGEAQREKGDLERSMQHFRACEQVASTLDDRLLQAEVLRNMGISLHRMGNQERARDYLGHSLEISKQMGARELEGLAVRALGDLAASTMWDTSHPEAEDQAEVHYQKALSIFRSIGADFECARTLQAMGMRTLERGDVEPGRNLLQEASSIFRRIGSKSAESVDRTLKEIKTERRSTPPPATRPSAAPDKSSKTETPSGKIETKESPMRRVMAGIGIGKVPRRARDTFPDLTDKIELLELEDE